MINISEDFILYVIGRKNKLFEEDLRRYTNMDSIVNQSRILVLGGGGSIGRAVVKELFYRKPRVLHVVDISENNLADLVRDIRSSYGYMDGDFKTFAIDIGSYIYDVFIKHSGVYDYIFNFSAVKHVRSEKDPYTLMRMVEVNILNTVKTIEQSIQLGVKKYFCVSTDKASNPVNMMGASKRIMELYLVKYSEKIQVSTARFANVAFSDGSLLHSFLYKIQRMQPIVIPGKVRRYFITPQEAAYLCLFSCFDGKNLEIFFPKMDPNRDLVEFLDIAQRFLNMLGYEPYFCNSEDEARKLATVLPREKKWACYISETDTTGEKEHEEFYKNDDIVEWDRYKDIGIIKLKKEHDVSKLSYFLDAIDKIKSRGIWHKEDIINLFKEVLPEFKHAETGKYLDDKM